MTQLSPRRVTETKSSCPSHGSSMLRSEFSSSLLFQAFAFRKADAPLDLLDGLVENVEESLEKNLVDPAIGAFSSVNNAGTNGADFGLETDIRASHLSPNQASPARSFSEGSGDLRRRVAGSSGELESGIHQYGRLQLTLRYSSHRLCLVVVVHKAW